MNGYAKPLPKIDEHNRPFWEGANDDKLLMQQCCGCKTYRFPAARFCARCYSEESLWVPVKGDAVIESFCFFHKEYFEGFSDEMPYNVALVRLTEGPRLFTNIVGVANADLRIGMEVRAHFDPIVAGQKLIKFRPA